MEAEEWPADGPLWIRGNRACDCARALLFAEQGEKVERACGSRAYAIRVTSPDGEELYREEDFWPGAEIGNRVPGAERDVPNKTARDASLLMAFIRSK
jgi:hypothetical protein